MLVALKRARQIGFRVQDGLIAPEARPKEAIGQRLADIPVTRAGGISRKLGHRRAGHGPPGRENCEDY